MIESSKLHSFFPKQFYSHLELQSLLAIIWQQCYCTLDVMMITFAVRLMEKLNVVQCLSYGGFGKSWCHYCTATYDVMITGH